MILPDVNVWIDALRTDAPHHDAIRGWLDGAIAAPEPVGASDLVLSAVVRIMTHPGIFPNPVGVSPLLDELDRIRAARGVVAVRPGRQHWRIFASLVRETECAGNAVPAAYLAALAIENDAVLVSSDRGLAALVRLGLRYRHPRD